MIVEVTNYYAKPGMAHDVLVRRRHGTRLRIALGLAPGRILLRQGAAGPDVRWECVFASDAALAADMAARDASPAFAEQRTEMGALLERFERQIFRVDDQELP
jgi:hypothetical protein